MQEYKQLVIGRPPMESEVESENYDEEPWDDEEGGHRASLQGKMKT